MRAVVLVLVLGCGGSAAPARPTTIKNNTAPVPAASADEELAAELAALPEESVLYVHPVGWFSTRTYAGYEGTNPRTGERVDVPTAHTIYWSPSPAFLAELAHAPSPILDHYPTEKARYRAAMSLQGDPPEDADDPTVVVRPAWSDALGARLRRELVAGGRAVIRGVGTLDVVHEGSATEVRFRRDWASEPAGEHD